MSDGRIKQQLLAQCKAAVSRQSSKPLAKDTELVRALENTPQLCYVLHQLLWERADNDSYWLDLLTYNKVQLAHIASHGAVLEQQCLVAAQRESTRASRWAWRNLDAVQVNASHQPLAVARLLAKHHDVAIAWYWSGVYHLVVAAEQLDCRQLGAELGNLIWAGRRCAVVTCRQLPWSTSRVWAGWMALGLGLGVGFWFEKMLTRIKAQ